MLTSEAHSASIGERKPNSWCTVTTCEPCTTPMCTKQYQIKQKHNRTSSGQQSIKIIIPTQPIKNKELLYIKLCEWIHSKHAF